MQPVRQCLPLTPYNQSEARGKVDLCQQQQQLWEAEADVVTVNLN